MPRWPARASATRTIRCTAPVAAPAAWPRRQRRTREAPRPGTTHPPRAAIGGRQGARLRQAPCERRSLADTPPELPAARQLDVHRRGRAEQTGDGSDSRPAARKRATRLLSSRRTPYRAGAGRRLSTSEDRKRAARVVRTAAVAPWCERACSSRCGGARGAARTAVWRWTFKTAPSQEPACRRRSERAMRHVARG